MRISQSAFDLIVSEEVSSRAYYERHYTHPEWPGGASGITIGIGYDLGYASIDKIRADWSPHCDEVMLAYLCACSGVKADAAKALLPKVKDTIVIPWDAAIDVFANRDVPHWTAAVIRRVPAAASLTDTCLGVQVSVAYNRGDAGYDLAGDRYSEMRAMKAHIQRGDLAAVPGDLRAMKRLWPGVTGLQNRREHEAVLWERGLTMAPDPAPVAPAPADADPTVLKPGPARTKPPVSTPAQHGTTIVIASGGAALAHHGYVAGLISPGLAAFGAFLAVMAGATAWIVWHRNRNP